MSETEKKETGKVKKKKIFKEKREFEYFIERPPFVGRYYIWQKDGKKYLFTHRHPHQAAYWSEEVGLWVPTDELKPA